MSAITKEGQQPYLQLAKQTASTQHMGDTALPFNVVNIAEYQRFSPTPLRDTPASIIPFPEPLKKEVALLDKKYEGDLARLTELQVIFEHETGIRLSQKELLKSYNPVYSRWKLEQLKTQEEREAFIQEEKYNMKTNLKERFHVEKTYAKYTFDDNGKLRSENFPNEAFEDVIERGIMVRARRGSQETEREMAELQGHKKRQEKFYDESTPIGAKEISISGPGLTEDSPYTENFIDIFEKKMDEKTGKIYVALTRFSTPLSYEFYKTVAENLRPGYFHGEKGPIDATLLKETFFRDGEYCTKTSEEVFEEIFGAAAGEVTDEEFEYSIYPPCIKIEDYYVKALFKDPFDPKNIVRAFNAYLDTADEQRFKLKGSIVTEKGEVITYKYANSKELEGLTLEEQIAIRGRREIQEIAGGCGPNGGFKMGQDAVETAISEVKNSVAQFGVPKELQDVESEIDYKFDQPGPCRDCKKDVNTGPCHVCKSCDIKSRIKKKQTKLAA